MSAAFVQNHGSGECAAIGTSVVVTLSGTHTPGNMLELCVGLVTQSRTITSVIGNVGAAWDIVRRQNRANCAHAKYTYPGTLQITSVTVTFNATSGGAIATVDEYSGSTTSQDTGASGAGAGTVGVDPAPTITWTPSFANELATASVCQQATAADTPTPSGWTANKRFNHSTLSLALSTFCRVNLPASSQTFTTVTSVPPLAWTALGESYGLPAGLSNKNCMMPLLGVQ